ncbi:hypothetical protein V2J09_018826 [Rumex salicifolius]
MSIPLSEHDYIGLSEPSSEVTSIAAMAEKLDQKQSSSLNLRATELRLGPPGSVSPERHAFPADGGYQLGFMKNTASGAKRGFSDVKSEKWGLAGNGDPEEGGGGLYSTNLNGSGSGSDGSSVALEKKPQNHNSSAALHASKAQVVGWPPIKSFRKNTMATNTQKTDTNKPENKFDSGKCLYVKVSMDNAPYLRKVDLTTYRSYAELSSALEKMFSCFTIGQYGYNGVPGRDGLSLSESRLKDVHNSEQCVLTYEDKDGDWMLHVHQHVQKNKDHKELGSNWISTGGNEEMRERRLMRPKAVKLHSLTPCICLMISVICLI